MKNYIANGSSLHLFPFDFEWLMDVIENGHWDTSKALVRRVLQQCTHLGRKFKSSGDNADQYEAFRLLGQAVS
jgi:hypothetical protein